VQGWTTWLLQSSNSWHYSRAISRVSTLLFIALGRSMSVPTATFTFLLALSSQYRLPPDTRQFFVSTEIDKETN
jgi:hypothetical protein